MNRVIWKNIGEVEFNLGGQRRLGRLIKVNRHTCLVQPLSTHPSCTAMNELHTKVIKRHLTKHKVTMNLAWTQWVIKTQKRDRAYLVFNHIWRSQPYQVKYNGGRP